MSGVYAWILVVVCTLGIIMPVSGENLAFVVTSWPNYNIYKATLPDTVGATLTFTTIISLNSGTGPRQLGYDPVDERIYWTESNAPDHISMCDLNGNNRKNFVTGTDNYGLALDVVNRIVYFSDLNSNGLSYVDMNLNGPARSIIGSQVGENPGYLAFGPDTMKLYYTYGGSGAGSGGVDSINMVGTGTGTSTATGRKTLVPGGRLSDPEGVFLDESAQKLYFGDRSLGRIYSLDLDETNPGLSLLFAEGSEPRGLTGYKDDIYWCDNDDDVIYRIAKDGSDNPTSPIIVPATFDGGALDGCKDIHFYIEEPCVANVVVTSSSASQLSVTWNTQTVLCPADVFRIDYEAIDVDQCDAEAGSVNTIPWQTLNSATLPGLKAYTTYRVVVTPGITTSVTNEGASVEITQATTEDVPSLSPPGVSYVTTDTSVAFSWLEIPCGSRGGLINSYAYRMSSNGNVVTSGAVLTLGVTLNSPPCGSVLFEVAGVNSAGMSDYSTLEYEKVSMEPFMPNTVLQISAITETSAIISWEKPECPPADYTLTLVNKGPCQSTPTEIYSESVEKDDDASVTLNILKPGTDYEIIVSSMTVNGVSREIVRDFVSLESDPSDSPQNLEISYASGRTAQFTWDEIPCESRGGTSFYYSYKFLVNGVELQSGRTSETSFTALDLPCGVVDFQVAGATDAGTGQTSEVSYDVNLSDSFQTDTPLSIASITATSAQISWTGTACPTSPFTVSYVLTNLEQCQPSNIATTFGQTTQSSVTLTGLSPGSSYMVTVQAQGYGNNIGRITSQVSFKTTDRAPIASPSNVQLTDSDRSTLSFSWDQIPCGSRGGVVVYKYELSRQSNDAIVVSEEITSTSVTIGGLTDGTNYDFRVAAINDAGPGQFSDPRDTPMTSMNATAIIVAVFSAVALVILILAAVNGFIYCRRFIQPGSSDGFVPASNFQTAKLPGYTSPFGVQRQGLSAQFGTGYY